MNVVINLAVIVIIDSCCKSSSASLMNAVSILGGHQPQNKANSLGLSKLPVACYRLQPPSPYIIIIIIIITTIFSPPAQSRRQEN